MLLKTTSKKYLFVAIIGFLCLSHLVKSSILPKMVLKGSFQKQNKPILTLRSWFSGEYQEEQEKYLNDNYSLRNLLVRVNNQINFTLFKTTSAKDVVIGKDNYLYGEKYILEYLGDKFVGYDKIKRRVRKIKKIQDTLAKINIELIVIVAAGKASYFPEYFPKKYLKRAKKTSNYDILTVELKGQSVQHIDFNKWFLSIKHTTKYPLFPKGGIHWSKYGEVLVADSIIHFIERIKDQDLAQVVIDTIERTKIMRDTDDDIEKGMNLLENLSDLEMAYPTFCFQHSERTVSPKTLVVGDSYYWGLYNSGLSKEVFNDGEFWFYNNEIYPEKKEVKKRVEDIKMQEEIEKNDIIILISTEANLQNFPFGFINNAYEIYFNYTLTSKDMQRVNHFKEKIKNSSKWLAIVKKQSKQQNISLEKAIQLNAEFAVKEEKRMDN